MEAGPHSERVRSSDVNTAATRMALAAVATILVSLFCADPAIAASLYIQTGSWRPIAAACQSATGSGTAEENLARLKAQAPVTPEVTAAIGVCEGKAATLRQEEQQIWIRALEAKKNWDCTDSRRQMRSLVQKASFYQLQASAELKRLGDCGEQLRTEESTDLLLQHAKTAYKGRDFRAAREQAWRLVKLGNSLSDQARTLLKDIEEIEIVNDLLRRADRSFRTGRVNDACSVLLGIQDNHTAFPNMAEVKSKLSGCPLTVIEIVSLPPSESTSAVATVPVAAAGSSSGSRGVPAGGSRGSTPAGSAEPKTELDRQLQAARIYIGEGNIELAGLRLAAALKLAPTDKTVVQTQELFQAAQQARALLDGGIDLIYQAKYADAATQLSRVVSSQTSAGLVAQAHFYIGVAMSHEYYLRGNGTDKTKAVQEFQNSVSVYSRPDFDQISPKIKQLYEEATGN